MGESGPDPLFRVGLPGDSATIEHHMEQLVKKARTHMILKLLALPQLILMGSFVMAEVEWIKVVRAVSPK